MAISDLQNLQADISKTLNRLPGILGQDSEYLEDEPSHAFKASECVIQTPTPLAAREAFCWAVNARAFFLCPIVKIGNILTRRRKVDTFCA